MPTATRFTVSDRALETGLAKRLGAASIAKPSSTRWRTNCRTRRSQLSARHRAQQASAADASLGELLRRRRRRREQQRASDAGLKTRHGPIGSGNFCRTFFAQSRERSAFVMLDKQKWLSPIGVSLDPDGPWRRRNFRLPSTRAEFPVTRQSITSLAALRLAGSRLYEPRFEATRRGVKPFR